MQSVPTTTNFVISKPAHGEVYRLAGRWFSLGTPASSTNKTDRHDITEILFESGVKHHNPNSITTTVLLGLIIANIYHYHD